MVLRIIPLIYTAYTRRSFCSGGPEVIGRSELQNDPLGVEHHQEAARRRRRRCGIFLGEAANVRDEQWPKPWLADWLIIICNNRGPHFYIYIYVYIYIHIHTHYPIFGDYIKRHCGNPYQPTSDFRISMRWTRKFRTRIQWSQFVFECVPCVSLMQNNTDTHTIFMYYYIYM